MKRETLKRIVAIVLVIVMLPVSEWVDTGIFNKNNSKTYADEVVNEAEQPENVKTFENIITLESKIGDKGEVCLKWNDINGNNQNDKKNYTYLIFRDNKIIASTNDIEYSDYNTESDGHYTYKVIVYLDENGVYGTSQDVSIDMPGDLSIDKDYTMNRDIAVYNLDIMKGNLDLNGYTLTVYGNVNAEEGYLLFNKGKLKCGGNVTFENNSDCKMIYSSDEMIVRGNLTCNSETDDRRYKFKNGRIDLYGDFTAAKDVQFSDALTMNLRGDGLQTITSDIIIDNLVSYNSSDAGIFLKNYNQTIKCEVNGNIRREDRSNIDKKEDVYVHNWTLDKDEVIEADLYISGGEVNLNGHTLYVKGNVNVTDGSLRINGGTLNVDGSVDVNYASYSEDIGDYVGKGNIIMDNDNDRINVKGYINIYTDNNIFNNGEISTDGDIYITKNVYIANNIRANSISIEGIIEIGGNVEVNEYNYGGGDIIMNKGKLIIYGYFNTQWASSDNIVLKMSHPEDYVCIYGRCDLGFAENICDGTIELKGKYNSINTYDNAKVILSGWKTQNISGNISNLIVNNTSIDGISIDEEAKIKNIRYEEITPSYNEMEFVKGLFCKTQCF